MCPGFLCRAGSKFLPRDYLSSGRVRLGERTPLWRADPQGPRRADRQQLWCSGGSLAATKTACLQATAHLWRSHRDAHAVHGSEGDLKWDPILTLGRIPVRRVRDSRRERPRRWRLSCDLIRVVSHCLALTTNCARNAEDTTLGRPEDQHSWSSLRGLSWVPVETCALAG